MSCYSSWVSVLDTFKAPIKTKYENFSNQVISAFDYFWFVIQKN